MVVAPECDREPVSAFQYKNGRAVRRQRGHSFDVNSVEASFSLDGDQSLTAALALFARMAELLVGDAEQFRKRLGRFGREIAVGSQVRLDDLRH